MASLWNPDCALDVDAAPEEKEEFSPKTLTIASDEAVADAVRATSCIFTNLPVNSNVRKFCKHCSSSFLASTTVSEVSSACNTRGDYRSTRSHAADTASQAAPEKPTTDKCRFFDLPPELRVIIYELSMTRHSLRDLWDPFAIAPPALLQTCKLIRHETIPVYTRRIEFCIAEAKRLIQLEIKQWVNSTAEERILVARGSSRRMKFVCGYRHLKPEAAVTAHERVLEKYKAFCSDRLAALGVK